jgi:hypothetical protein
MFRKCLFQVCGFTLVLGGSSTVALGQYYTPATQPYNPFSSIGGYAGRALSQQYGQNTGSPSLNQVALRNAQQIMQQSYQPTGGMPSAGRIGLGLDTSYSGQKPFTGFSQGPAVSPYLNLFRVDQNGFQGFNYSTLVAPELRQQQINQQQQQQNTQTTRRLQAISAQADYNIQGSKEEFPTGHQTVFQYMGHYYPQQRPHQKKKAQ